MFEKVIVNLPSAINNRPRAHEKKLAGGSFGGFFRAHVASDTASIKGFRFNFVRIPAYPGRRKTSLFFASFFWSDRAPSSSPVYHLGMPIKPCLRFGCPRAAEPGRSLCAVHIDRPVPCRAPGCPAIVRGAIRCPRHEAEHQAEMKKRAAEYARRTDERRGTAAERGYDHRWKKARDSHLARFPLCAACARAGRLNGASMVHHKVPLEEGGSRLAADNLESMCRECHEALHGRAKFEEGCK